MSPEVKKYLFFVLVALACVASDQATKQWAEHRLSAPNPPIGPPQSFTIEVPAGAAGLSLQDFLRKDLVGTTDFQVEKIARGGVIIDGKRNFLPGYQLQGSETLEVTTRRDVQVVEDFFHFRYTRNPGAAFGFLAQADASWRRAFFIGVSVLAVLVILFIFRRVDPRQKLLVWSLSLIVGGALGNFIDRLIYGWVIDFIDWHYYREYTWPTFNVADAYITIGVALMALEILVGKEPPQEAEALAAAQGVDTESQEQEAAKEQKP